MGLTMRYLKKWIETQDWHALELYYQERVFENWKLGLHNGKKIGIKIGKLRGIKIGKQETNEIIAKKMLEDNVKIKNIVKYTGLSFTEIKNLKVN